MNALLPEYGLSLLDVLQALPQERPLLQTGEVRLSIAEVVTRALALRTAHADWEGQVRVFHSLSPLDFLVELVAWDGFCRRLILLPSSLNPEKAMQQAADVPQFTDSKSTQWLLATSGTSGEPKLIAHTLASLSQSLKRDPQAGTCFRWGLVYDPSRFAGLQVVLQAFFSGAELVITPLNDYDEQVRSLVANRISALSATPTLWRKFAMDGRLRDCPLRQITLGGEIVDQKLLDHLRQSFPEARITHIYASTEAGVGFAVTDGRAGFPLAFVTEGVGRTRLRVDARGHLWLRPPLSPAGNSTWATDEEGYIDSGDRVEIHGDRISFLGRSNGVINVGGNKVHPEKIEEVLRELSQILEVRVAGKKNPLTGELVVADVVPKEMPGDETLRRQILVHCRHHLENWQIPALVRFVPHIDVSGTGKVNRTGA